jgi:hypothetical protein
MNGSMSMKVEINQPTSKEQSFICAVYDKDTGQLLSVRKDDKQMIKGVPQTFECVVDIPEKFYDRRIKAFLWDKNLVPWGDGGILYEGE